MTMVIEGFTVRLRDPTTGTVETRDLHAGSAWPCANGQGSERPAKEREREPKPAKPDRKRSDKLDLRDAKARDDFDNAVFAAIVRGRQTPQAIHGDVGGDRMQVSAALVRLLDQKRVLRSGSGRGVKYSAAVLAESAPAPAPAEVLTPAPKPKPRQQTRGEAPPKPGKAELPALEWKPATLKGRKTWVARWDDGAFRIIKLPTGADALFFERGQDTLYEYGCGRGKDVKLLARELAARGMPTPDEYRQSGGELGACPPEQVRTTRLGEVELTWKETVQEGRQLCVAATSDGEFRMVQSKGGSFALVFVRQGDDGFEDLGCGTKATLEARALELLAEQADERAADEAEPGRPEPAPIVPNPAMDSAITESLRSALGQLG